MSNPDMPTDYELAWWLLRAGQAELRRKHAADFSVAAGAATIACGLVTMMVSATPATSSGAEEYVGGLRATLLALAAFLALLWWTAGRAEKKLRHARGHIEAEAYQAGISVSASASHAFRVSR